MHTLCVDRLLIWVDYGFSPPTHPRNAMPNRFARDPNLISKDKSDTPARLYSMDYIYFANRFRSRTHNYVLVECHPRVSGRDSNKLYTRYCCCYCYPHSGRKLGEFVCWVWYIPMDLWKFRIFLLIGNGHFCCFPLNDRFIYDSSD